MEASEVEVTRKGQEGSRWINERPEGDQVAEWFNKNCKLHDERLKHDDYVSGITLIQTTENVDTVRGARADGTPLIVEERHVVYVPYMKVETRVKYWHDLLALHPEWRGEFIPAYTERVETEGYFNRNLPDHFFRHPVRVGENKVANFIGCSMRAVIYQRDGDKIVLEGAPGTKVVNLLNRYGEDPNAVMKAETGAIGRALGMAGILVIPGSGVATAEDVQEAIAAEGRSSTSDGTEASLSMAVQSDVQTDPVEALRGTATELLGKLAEHPGDLTEFQEWARGRQFQGLDTLNEVALKGVVKKLERTLDEIAQRPAEPDSKPEPEADSKPEPEPPEPRDPTITDEPQPERPDPTEPST